MARRGSRRHPQGAGPQEDTVRLEQRLFRRRRWRGRAAKFRWLVLAVLFVAVVGAGVWALYFSSLLTVRRVDVVTGPVTTQSQVRDAAAIPLGTPLVRVDLSAAQRRIQRLPAVRAVRLSRQWPHDVRIVVTERTAVAVVASGGTFHGLDETGMQFRTYPKRPAALPLVEAKRSAPRDAMREAARVVGALPVGLLHRVTVVHVATIDQIALSLRGGQTVEWGSAEQSAAKAQVLEILLKRGAHNIDVSVPGRPTTKG